MAGMPGDRILGPDETGLSIMPVAMDIHAPIHIRDPNMGYFQGLYEPVVLNAFRPHKPRRKSGQGAGRGVDRKHRRTRSGCFTCRSRRVKCDETRPVCDRCKKGSRDCIYPEPQVPKCRQKQTTKSKDTRISSSPPSSLEGYEYEVDRRDTKTESLNDDEKGCHDISRRRSSSDTDQRASTSSPDQDFSNGRQASETPSQDTQSTPSATSVMTRTWPSMDYHTPETIVSPLESLDQPSFDQPPLPSVMQHYLAFFADHITNYHYSLTIDEDGYFKAILLRCALECEPLLNAVVGFSAYHAALQAPNGRLDDFLHFYDRSVTQLLQILERNEMHSVQVLLTILQLATIEEFLGDWVSLMGHQKAAFEIIMQMFCPETVTHSPIHRMCLNWYARFDHAVALTGGFPPDIAREWLVAMLEFYQSHLARDPQNLRWKSEERCARLRLISHNISSLFARRNCAQIILPDYNLEYEQLSMQLEAWRTGWDPAVVDPFCLVPEMDIELWNQTSDLNPLLDQDILMDQTLFDNLILTAHWHSISIMHKSQSLSIHAEDVFEELSQHAHAVCQLFAFMEHWPSAPPGTLIAMQQCMFTAALVLPHIQDNNLWLKRKFALLESLG